MLRKVFRTGNSIVVSLPKEVLDYLGIEEGSQVSVELDKGRNQVLITPIPIDLTGVDEVFARQVSEFIERYRSALTTLAK